MRTTEIVKRSLEWRQAMQNGLGRSVGKRFYSAEEVDQLIARDRQQRPTSTTAEHEAEIKAYQSQVDNLRADLSRTIAEAVKIATERNQLDENLTKQKEITLKQGKAAERTGALRVLATLQRNLQSSLDKFEAEGEYDCANVIIGVMEIVRTASKIYD